MVVDEGLLALLRILENDVSVNTQIGLFTDDITPDHATTLGGLTEPGFSGYARISAASVSFSAPAINGSAEGESDSATITFTCTSDPGSPIVVHGIFVCITDPTSSVRLFFADRFGTPVTITHAGDTVEKKLNWFDANFTP